MQPQTESRNKYIGVLLPSGASAFLCAFAAAVIFGANQFGTIRERLQIPQGDFGVEHAILAGLNSFLTTVFGVTRANSIVLGFFWALVGLVVYAFLRGFMQLMNELGQDVEIRRYAWPKGVDRNQPLEGFFERNLFRVVVGIVIIFYIGHFAGYALADHPEFPIWVNGLVSFLGSWVLWHGLVVLLRLLFLKDRLIGS